MEKPMEPVEHVAHLREQGERLVAVAETCRPETTVPTCAGWTFRDLARHMGGIHRWAARIVSEPRVERWSPDLLDVAGSWPPDAALGEWLHVGSSRLVGVLEDAPDDLVCFTPLEAPSSRAMWCRRQAHETTIHRVDAELAAGGDTDMVPPQLAADGIDELLGAFVTRRRCGLEGVEGERRIEVRSTDTGDTWTVHSHARGVETTAGPSAVQPDCQSVEPTTSTSRSGIGQPRRR